MTTVGETLVRESAAPPRLRVAVVGGGTSCEHEISLGSAAGIAAALDASRFEAVPLTIGLDGRWGNPAPFAETTAASLVHAVGVLASCDVVIPAVHGPGGEDGTLAALCALAGIPCAGSGVGAGALAMDKWATKLVAEAVGVRVAPGRLDDPSGVPVTWTGPVVVKPVAAGSSHGVTLVRDPAELAAALDTARALDPRVLVEELLIGREIDIAVLRRADGSLRLSPPLEIHQPVGGVFGTTEKYDGSARFEVPASLTPGQRTALEDAAMRIFEALDCDGVARVDFFLTANGWVLNEVNTFPGMTAHSQVPLMFAADGLDYADLLTELVDGTLTRVPA